ncbi:hypothetical protein PIB30_022663 [Stylosanthes scabra]|uniref:Leucine-rich repeat-containing N-terminal plant-type domain-containing protein n=1 Tax=Stylosanthes scabra TaxID=79078 RepID=A0ABU6V878_9FABA|nr:hypothetical protein [Stylosanthes scabra]
MECPWKKPWLIFMMGAIVLILLLGSNNINGCFTEEKRSLLDFKAAYSSDNLLPSWVNNSSSNCCEWERVTCDPLSGHVTHLSLESLNRIPTRSLNGSLFLSFKYLTYLSLSQNYFDGFIWDTEYVEDNGSKSSTLLRLETIDLSSNKLKENIMEFVYGLTSLRSLILSNNKLGGLFPSKELSVLRNLELLDLSYNLLSGSLTTQGQGPFSLGNLTSLQTLDLSHNYLSGNIPEPFLARLSSLEHLSLSFNNFEGLFSLSILANHSKLKYLEIGDMTSKTFQVQTENPPWNASFQLENLRDFLLFPSWFFKNRPTLEYIFLSQNSFVGSFELPLDDQSQHMNQLYTLDISNNLIQGLLPTNIGFFFPFLNYLDVSSNMFDGPIPSSIGEMSTLTSLDLSNNNFSGNFPKHFFNGCISLKSLAMDNNRFNGTFPSFVGNLNLTRITASRNNFEGEITEDMCELNQLISLMAFDLSYNNFSGELPSCLNMPSAGLINLQGNSLTGTIPEALLNGSARWAIDLSNNKFVGTIPESVYGLQNLMFLMMGGNHLQGQIPDQICQLRYLQILDLSGNNFTGSVPSCFNRTTFAPGTHSRGDSLSNWRLEWPSCTELISQPFERSNSNKLPESREH